MNSVRQMQTAAGRAPVHQAIAALHPVDRIVIYGAGPSMGIAAYLEVMLNRHGQRAKVIGHGGQALADQLLDFSAQDGLLLFSYGEPYHEVLVTAAEAAARKIPIVLVTDNPAGKLAKTAAVVLPARRGWAEHVALHGATLITLEALLMGLAVANRAHTIATLERLAGTPRGVEQAEVRKASFCEQKEAKKLFCGAMGNVGDNAPGPA